MPRTAKEVMDEIDDRIAKVADGKSVMPVASELWRWFNDLDALLRQTPPSDTRTHLFHHMTYVATWLQQAGETVIFPGE